MISIEIMKKEGRFYNRFYMKQRWIYISIIFCTIILNFYQHQEIESLNNQIDQLIDKTIIPNNTSKPFVGRMNLDSETEKSFYGTWKVEKLLGFANSYNDASEYPTGQKIIGDKIVIKKAFFSSKGLKNYNAYQHELKNPLYSIEAICYNSDSFYRVFKIDLPGLNINDEVKHIGIVDSSIKLGIPVSFFIVNNDRLILLLEATCFELEKVTD